MHFRLRTFGLILFAAFPLTAGAQTPDEKPLLPTTSGGRVASGSESVPGGNSAPAGTGTRSPNSPLTAPGTDEQPVSPDQAIEDFKSTAPEGVLEAGLAAVESYDEEIAAYVGTMIEMRRTHTAIANEFSDDRKAYFELRNRARLQMNQCYDLALDVLRYMPHPGAARFMVTVIQHRVDRDVYDRSTLEGAARLLDAGVRLRYVAHAAARSGMVAGDFELARRVYQNLQEDELEKIDFTLVSTADKVEKQFEIEQELLAKDPEDLPRVRFKTTRGDVVAELYINEAPSTVSHFIQLVEDGFYDGLDWFQVVDDLLALTGDPAGDGSTIPDQFIADEHQRETIRMPLSGSLVMAKMPITGTSDFLANSGGTQFAVLYLPFPAVISQQTVFGRVIEGMDVIGELRRVDPNKKKEKGELVLPPDRIIECEIINRPETLPEVQYAKPTGASHAGHNH